MTSITTPKPKPRIPNPKPVPLPRSRLLHAEEQATSICWRRPERDGGNGKENEKNQKESKEWKEEIPDLNHKESYDQKNRKDRKNGKKSPESGDRFIGISPNRPFIQPDECSGKESKPESLCPNLACIDSNLLEITEAPVLDCSEGLHSESHPNLSNPTSKIGSESNRSEVDLVDLKPKTSKPPKSVASFIPGIPSDSQKQLFGVTNEYCGLESDRENQRFPKTAYSNLEPIDSEPNSQSKKADFSLKPTTFSTENPEILHARGEKENSALNSQLHSNIQERKDEPIERAYINSETILQNQKIQTQNLKEKEEDYMIPERKNSRREKFENPNFYVPNRMAPPPPRNSPIRRSLETSKSINLPNNSALLVPNNSPIKDLAESFGKLDQEDQPVRFRKPPPNSENFETKTFLMENGERAGTFIVVNGENPMRGSSDTTPSSLVVFVDDVNRFSGESVETLLPDRLPPQQNMTRSSTASLDSSFDSILACCSADRESCATKKIQMPATPAPIREYVNQLDMFKLKSRSRETEMSITPERFVPQEYSSSPIVEHLANSREERPSPPINFSSQISRNDTDTPKIEADSVKKPSLLEQIVRSHPIWFLQSFGRGAVTHLLKPMKPGTFIVRSSSRSGSMALSIRLPDGHDMDVDHYVIELCPREKLVRLESSPYSFNSLPILIEHYCKRGEELQCHLRLPSAVRACPTTSSLHSLALMGPDFWTSSMALSSIGSAGSSSSSSPSPLLGRISSRFERAIDKSRTENNEKDFPKKRPFSFRSKSGDGRRRGAPNVEALLFASTQPNQQNPLISPDAPSPPSKHERVAVPPSPILTQRGEIIGRSSLRNEKKKPVPPISPSLSGAKADGNRRSFLRSLFSFGSNHSHQTGQNVSSSSISSPSSRAPITQLATCHYFFPHPDHREHKVKGSRSAFELQEPFGEDTVFNSGPSMKTFKTYNWNQDGSSMPSSPLSGIRRERNDLSTPMINPAARIAKHLEGSPGPPNITNSPRADRVPLRPPQNAFDQNVMKNCVEELRRKRLQTTDEMLRGESSGDSSVNGETQQMNIKTRVTGGSWRGPSREQRLSVPNMPDESVLHSARAIREKIGRTEGGELRAINEGLVTPVVRRKQFTTVQHSPNETETMSTGSEEERREVPPHGTVSRNRDALEAILDPSRKPEVPFPRRYHSERSRSSRHAEETKRIEPLPQKPKFEEEKNNNTKPPQGGYNGQPGSSTWGAIAGELKSRQKIAKVRPTPQVRLGTSKTNPPTTSMGMAVKEETGRHSDYAQLGDFLLCSPNTTQPNSSTSSLLAPKDEDAVSVAGTVFNEPWDSNVWENLLDLAQHGDPRPNRMNETITEEEDTGSDRTGGSSSQMQDSDDELELALSTSYYSSSTQRKIPSDHVTVKAWEKENGHYGNFSTIDSRREGSQRSTLGRNPRVPSPEPSMHSLPRAVSRFSEACMGSLDDLPALQNLNSFSPLISSPRKKTQVEDLGASTIQKYVEKLAESATTVFGATVRRFIECTVEGEECDPMVVIRNVRQFINGIKNYLVKHGEGDLHELITIETSRLNANQILNIDAILEAVLHKILLRPVKPHLYHLMVKEQSRSGTLQALSTNLAIAKGMSLKELGFRNPEQLHPPTIATMDQIKMCLRKMQHHYSPLKKLENLLRAVSLVAQPDRWSDEENVGSNPETLKRTQSIQIPNADDLVRWFVYILSRTSTVGCEVEAWYMWELLPQQMITQGDASFYLGALFSAVHILKNADAIRRMPDDAHVRSTLDLSRGCTSNSSLSSDAFLRVAVPDELNGCIRYCTLPGVPQMTVSKICKVVAHQQGITNPEDYGLYILRSGFEDCLHPSDSPFLVREVARTHQTPHLFVYKRHDAKIAWPQQLPVTRSPAIGNHTTPQLSI